jgi:hypothetical protein
VNYTLPFRVSGDGVESLPSGTFGRGGATGVVFMDEDGDGVRGPLEPTLADVRIVAPGIKDLVTDDDGRYSGWGVSTKRPVSFGVDPLTTDALFVPARKNYRMVVRPGELVKLDFPLVPSGGLSGLLTTEIARSISPAHGIVMNLENEAGIKFITVQVEWDGSFLMEGIPPGSYLLSVDAEGLAARGLELIPDRMKLKFPAGEEPAWLEDIVFLIRNKGGGKLPHPEARGKQ